VRQHPEEVLDAPLYEDYYHLQAKPFSAKPYPPFFFLQQGSPPRHVVLVYGVHQGEGFIVITGRDRRRKDPCARTRWRASSHRRPVLAQVVSTHLKADDLVRTVAAGFGCPGDSQGGVAQQGGAVSLAATGRTSGCSDVDEAQNLPPESVEAAADAVNFACDAKPLLQISCWDSRSSARRCGARVMEQLSQRVIASCHRGRWRGGDRGLHRASAAKRWLARRSVVRRGCHCRIHRTAAGFAKDHVLCDRLCLWGAWMRSRVYRQGSAAVINEMNQEFASRICWTRVGNVDAVRETELRKSTMSQLRA